MDSMKTLIKKTFSPKLILTILTWKHLRQKFSELQLIKVLVPQNTSTIDIGVYMGVFSNVMARHSKNVYSFEPHPQHYTFSKTALPSNVEIFNTALSNEQGETTLTVPKLYPSAGKVGGSFEGLEVEEYTVKKTTLDSFNFDNISLIKIDAEGHEYEILMGALDTINSNKPCLIIEIEQRHQERSVQVVFDFILNLGYEGFFIMNKNINKLELFDLSFQKGTEIGVEGKYINNFIFIHKDNLKNFPQFLL